LVVTLLHSVVGFFLLDSNKRGASTSAGKNIHKALLQKLSHKKVTFDWNQENCSFRKFLKFGKFKKRKSVKETTNKRKNSLDHFYKKKELKFIRFFLEFYLIFS